MSFLMPEQMCLFSKLSTTLNTLKANDDPPQSPAKFHDAAVIQLLSNDLSTLVMDVTIQKDEFNVNAFLITYFSVDPIAQTVEERVKSSSGIQLLVLMHLHMWLLQQ